MTTNTPIPLDAYDARGRALLREALDAGALSPAQLQAALTAALDQLDGLQSREEASAPTEEVAPHRLRWFHGYDLAGRISWSASSCQWADDSPLAYRITCQRERISGKLTGHKLYLLSQSDTELLPCDGAPPFRTLDEAQAYCQMLDDEALQSILGQEVDHA